MNNKLEETFGLKILNLMIRVFKRFDLILVLLILAVSIYGFIVFLSAVQDKPSFISRRILQLVVGFVCLFIFTQIPAFLYKKWIFIAVGGTILLLLAVKLFGISVNGSQRWLNLIVFKFQPSELAKFIVPMALANVVSNQIPIRLEKTLLCVVLLTVPTVLVFLEPDLGTSLIIAAGGAVVIFMAGLGWRIIFSLFAALLVLIPIFWNFIMKDYQKVRVLSIINNSSDTLGSAYHVIQSKIAIGSGGFWGKGWFNGTQVKYDFLPESHTDFIFSVLAEEFGLFGALVLLALYLCILLRLVVLFMNNKDVFGRLVIIAFGFIFFLYVFINIGMVSRILPVVGVPLPFVSYGGTSYVLLMITFGIIMSINSDSGVVKNKNEKKLTSSYRNK